MDRTTTCWISYIKLKTLRKIEPYKGKGIREKGQYILKEERK